MDKNFVDIIKNVMNYLDLKRECTEKHYETLCDVIYIFNNELVELTEVTNHMNIYMNELNLEKCDENIIGKTVIDCYEENLVNEIADVLLTSARLIYEFNLQEALSEMIEYKYERQKSRELNRFKNNKNELLK